MEDDASILLDGKTLANLRVVDLKLELEKRGLSKSGSKKDLVKRLKQQLEFEKLSSERKSTGDCDLKLELDADTEQNEFVQQYLAQQQKIYAEQKEVKRRIELEEIQKSGDEKESCDSSKDDDKTEDEAETANPVLATNSLLHKHAKSKENDSDDVFKAEDAVPLPLIPQDTKNSEEAREKELSTAISSLLSVDSKVEEKKESCNEDLTLVEATRTTHDDDREKDLATAVLSSLLVEDQDETEAKEEASREQIAYNVTEDSLQSSTESDVHNLESKGTEVKNVEVVAPVEDACNRTEGSELSVESGLQPSQLSVPGLETKAKNPETKYVEVVSQVQDGGHVTQTPLQLSAESDVQPSQLSADVDACGSETKMKDFKTKTVQNANKSTEEPSQIVAKSNVCESETKCKDGETDNVTLIVPSRSSEESKARGTELKCIDSETRLPVIESCEKDVAAELGVPTPGENVEHNPVFPAVDKKSTDESSEITQPDVLKMSGKIDVSSVPYSLAEIQLPESPGKISKPPTKMQVANDAIKTTEPEEDVQNNVNSSSKKIKNLESDLNGKGTILKEDPSPSLAKVVENSGDIPEPSLKKESEKTMRRVKDSEENKSRRNRSTSDSCSDNDTRPRNSKRKDHIRRKRYDSSDDDRSSLKKSSTSSKKHKDRKSDSSRDRSKSPKKDLERSSRRNRKRSISSEDDRSSRTRSKKSSPKRESRRKRDRKHRSSSSEEDRYKSLKESSPKKKRGHSKDERPSKTRSRSPKKPVKDNTSKRVHSDQSSEDEPSSKTRSKSPKKLIKDDVSKTVDKDQSSEDERTTKGRSKSPNKTIEDSSSKKVRRGHSSETDQPLNIPSKDLKNVVQDSKQHSGKSSDSEGEQSSKVRESLIRTEGKKEQRKTSEREQHSDQHNKDSPKRESKHKEREHKKRDRKLEDKHDALDLDSLQKKTSNKSEDLDKKDIQGECEASDVKPSRGNISRDRSLRSPSREKEKSSSRSKSPGEDKSDSMTLQSDSVPEITDNKTSKDKSDSIMPEVGSSTEPKDVDREKESCSPKDQQSSEVLPDEAQKVAILEAASSKLKADVSEGELSSSRENSPCRKEKIVVIRRPSSNSKVPVEGTMTVIRKEAPKQRIRIKRDNVVVVKKEDRLPEKELSKTDDSISKVPESAEEQKLEPGEYPEAAPYVSSRKITLSNRKRTETPVDESSGKRSKWGSFAASRNKAKQVVSISTDSLKNWFPDFKLLKEPPVIEPVSEEPSTPTKESNDVEMPEKKDSEEPKLTITTRKSSHPPPAEEESVKPMHLEDVDGVTPTKILFVRNLVRPFTLLQLKDLLKETGNIVEDKFWIDKIKSKCFVVYETEEDAVKTRCTLNGARWPTSNPKILAVDYATEEDLEFHRSGAVDHPKPRPQSPPPHQPRVEEEEHRRPIEREGRRERARDHLPMREWDKDKVTQDSPEKLDRRRGDEGKGVDKERKEKRARGGLEETPAKLLDDLFQKTKATPCIYWLPLTQEQVKARAEQARVDKDRRHQEQENKRPRSKPRTREMDTRRSSTRSRSPVSRRR